MVASAVRAHHVIGDALLGAGARGTFATHDPHDGSWLADVPVGGPEEVDAAVRAARAAFPAWAALGPEGRRPQLHALADLVDRDAEALALLETRDSGKPIRQSRADIARGALQPALLRRLGGAAPTARRGSTTAATHTCATSRPASRRASAPGTSR